MNEKLALTYTCPSSGVVILTTGARDELRFFKDNGIALQLQCPSCQAVHEAPIEACRLHRRRRQVPARPLMHAS